MAKLKEYESKSVKYNTLVSDKIFTVINTLFMIAFVVITLYPVLNTLAISLNDGTDALRGGIYLFPRKWTLQNYKTVIHKNNLINGAVVSVARTFIGTLTSLAANALLAFIVSRKRFLFKSQLSLFWVVTMYVNGGLIPVFLLYKGLNLTNSFWVYIVPGMLSAFNMLVIRTYMTGIPDSLEESAQLDGAGYMTIFIKIVSPLCKPVYATVALFVAVGQWNSWFDNHIYTRGNESLTTLQYLLYNYLNEAQRLADQIKNTTNAAGMSQLVSNSISPKGIRMTITVLASLPIFMVYPFMQKYFVKGIMVGAVKG